MAAASQNLMTCLRGLYELRDPKLDAEGLILVTRAAILFWLRDKTASERGRNAAEPCACMPERHACQVHLRVRGLGCSRLAGLGCRICSAGSMMGAARGVCHTFGADSGVCAGLLCVGSTAPRRMRSLLLYAVKSRAWCCGTLHIILCHSTQPARTCHLHRRERSPWDHVTVA